MSKFLVEGGGRVGGTHRVQGAKNSALPILAATLLSGSVCTIHRCPQISDVETAAKILENLGCTVSREGETLTVDTAEASHWEIPDNLMREMRSSVMFLGAILARMGQAQISFPGGCELGPRPIDLHISAMEALGATVLEEHGFLRCDAPSLRGTEILLAMPSVGATENILLAAVTAEGVTTITNAAQEPEIEDLQNFLNAMGAKVSGAGSRCIQVEGVPRLHGAEYSVMPDRIVTATYMAAAAVTGGELELRDVVPQHLAAVSNVFRESGCEVEANADTIYFKAPSHILPVRVVRTMPYPAFPTDALAPMMAYLSLARGSSLFIETIFQNRYKHVEELMRLGAKIKVEGQLALVEGTHKLTCAHVEATDLRGGAALVVAALAASGTTTIDRAELIERGYEDLAGCLNRLGAAIKREE